MTMLHLILPDDTFESQEYQGALELGAPEWEVIREMLGFRSTHNIEHVSVLWKGKPAHMFVHEHGLAMQLPLNRRASRIYANLTLWRARPDEALQYNELDVLPEKLLRECIIVGPALLWEGGME